MMHLLFEEILFKELEKYKNNKILVAFSGGKDSLALLDFLNKKKDILHIFAGACYINHGLRETALRDEIFCRDYCNKHSIEFYTFNILQEIFNDKSCGVESAARKYRYKYLLELVYSKNYDYLFTAHTYSDNIENFFIDLYTGTSIYTISGIMEENNNVENVQEVANNVENQGEVTLENSNIKIADDVIAVIAGAAASEVPGVASMAGGFAGGISEVFSGKKNFAKGIKVEAGEKETRIDVNIIVEYGVRIPDVAFEIQNRVKKAVESMTGLKVVDVNVHVQGVNTDSNNMNEVKTEDSNKTE